MYKRKKDKLIQGVGINDAYYKVIGCPYYAVWVDMIRRAYDDKYKARKISYKNVTVCEEWHRFTIFREWMVKQDWQGKELDKDLIVSGNKVYSPSTCCFLSGNTNKILVSRKHKDSSKLVGVRYPEKDKINPIRNCTMSRKYGCNKPGTARIFETAEEAHLHWAKAKFDKLLGHSRKHDDIKVKQALIDHGLMLVAKARLLIDPINGLSLKKC